MADQDPQDFEFDISDLEVDENSSSTSGRDESAQIPRSEPQTVDGEMDWSLGDLEVPVESVGPAAETITQTVVPEAVQDMPPSAPVEVPPVGESPPPPIAEAPQASRRPSPQSEFPPESNVTSQQPSQPASRKSTKRDGWGDFADNLESLIDDVESFDASQSQENAGQYDQVADQIEYQAAQQRASREGNVRNVSGNEFPPQAVPEAQVPQPQKGEDQPTSAPLSGQMPQSPPQSPAPVPNRGQAPAKPNQQNVPQAAPQSIPNQNFNPPQPQQNYVDQGGNPQHANPQYQDPIESGGQPSASSQDFQNQPQPSPQQAQPDYTQPQNAPPSQAYSHPVPQNYQEPPMPPVSQPEAPEEPLPQDFGEEREQNQGSDFDQQKGLEESEVEGAIDESLVGELVDESVSGEPAEPTTEESESDVTEEISGEIGEEEEAIFEEGSEASESLIDEESITSDESTPENSDDPEVLEENAETEEDVDGVLGSVLWDEESGNYEVSGDEILAENDGESEGDVESILEDVEGELLDESTQNNEIESSVEDESSVIEAIDEIKDEELVPDESVSEGELDVEDVVEDQSDDALINPEVTGVEEAPVLEDESVVEDDVSANSDTIDESPEEEAGPVEVTEDSSDNNDLEANSEEVLSENAIEDEESQDGLENNFDVGVDEGLEDPEEGDFVAEDQTVAESEIGDESGDEDSTDQETDVGEIDVDSEIGSEEESVTPEVTEFVEDENSDEVSVEDDDPEISTESTDLEESDDDLGGLEVDVSDDVEDEQNINSEEEPLESLEEIGEGLESDQAEVSADDDSTEEFKEDVEELVDSIEIDDGDDLIDDDAVELPSADDLLKQAGSLLNGEGLEAVELEEDDDDIDVVSDIDDDDDVVEMPSAEDLIEDAEEAAASSSGNVADRAGDLPEPPAAPISLDEDDDDEEIADVDDDEMDQDDLSDLIAEIGDDSAEGLDDEVNTDEEDPFAVSDDDDDGAVDPFASSDLEDFSIDGDSESEVPSFDILSEGDDENQSNTTENEVAAAVVEEPVEGAIEKEEEPNQPQIAAVEKVTELSKTPFWKKIIKSIPLAAAIAISGLAWVGVSYKQEIVEHYLGYDKDGSLLSDSIQKVADHILADFDHKGLYRMQSLESDLKHVSENEIRINVVLAAELVENLYRQIPDSVLVDQFSVGQKELVESVEAASVLFPEMLEQVPNQNWGGLYKLSSEKGEVLKMRVMYRMLRENPEGSWMLQGVNVSGYDGDLAWPEGQPKIAFASDFYDVDALETKRAAKNYSEKVSNFVSNVQAMKSSAHGKAMELAQQQERRRGDLMDSLSQGAFFQGMAISGESSENTNEVVMIITETMENGTLIKGVFKMKDGSKASKHFTGSVEFVKNENEITGKLKVTTLAFDDAGSDENLPSFFKSSTSTRLNLLTDGVRVEGDTNGVSLRLAKNM